MQKSDEYRLWLTTQRTYLEALLAEYRSGARRAVYTLRNGKRVDETAQVILQLEKDLARLG